MSIAKLGFCAVVITAVAVIYSSVEAQQPQQPQRPKITLSSLTAQGFEIKAAFPDGTLVQMYLQKGKDVFHCVVYNGSACDPVQ